MSLNLRVVSSMGLNKSYKSCNVAKKLNFESYKTIITCLQMSVISIIGVFNENKNNQSLYFYRAVHQPTWVVQSNKL